MLQLVPRPLMAATAGPPGSFAALQMVPPDQLWHHGWSPFAAAGPPYNPAFIALTAIQAEEFKQGGKHTSRSYS